jgi:hypothetical protein
MTADEVLRTVFLLVQLGGTGHVASLRGKERESFVWRTFYMFITWRTGTRIGY